MTTTNTRKQKRILNRVQSVIPHALCTDRAFQGICRAKAERIRGIGGLRRLYQSLNHAEESAILLLKLAFFFENFGIV